MPRWPIGYVARKWQVCPRCGGKKDYYAKSCWNCTEWGKPWLEVTGDKHPAWKGGFVVDCDGYIRTWAPDHPWPRKSGYVLEHVRVMELEIGRRLSAKEVVHHRDGNRQNNAIVNLQLMTASAHSKLHRRMDTKFRNRTPDGKFAGKEVQHASE